MSIKNLLLKESKMLGTFIVATVPILSTLDFVRMLDIQFNLLTPTTKFLSSFLMFSFSFLCCYVYNLKEPKPYIPKLKLKDEPGFIYIFKREDGIYKIGKSKQPKIRKFQHELEYKMGFTTIKCFTVSDMTKLENLALQLTNAFAYNEKGRVELRKMTKDQLDIFIKHFTEICKNHVIK